ncbi:CDP-diacylglycerol-choline O-phosphatidyltransferase [Bradyrhizobium brasilense]|uniref:Phosphatidylcholine synthase n=2 Tax=Nitrobacteraceae TaxID=41294 RepID=A0A1G7AGV1_9BRAD|nr:CDP-diacylglycerol-choline O-phosphatidyltransferase [Bradyrhizobium brasilense]
MLGPIFKPSVTTKSFQRFARRNAARPHMQTGPIPDSTRPMEHSSQPDALPERMRTAAFSVHIFTALGAGVALLAMLEAVREHWANMFAWLGVALIIDGIDGPLARRLDVVRLQPNWSGEVLDLVVDFVTYVFVPAYAITASGMLLPLAAPILGVGIVVSSALYFADRRMKADDNHFRGFPALWNAAAFYLFLLHLPPVLSTIVVALLIVLTFAPFHVLHPLRVVRLRWLTLWLLGAWALLGMYTLANDFVVGAPITFGLCAIAVYIIGSDTVIRRMKAFRA